MQLRPGRLSKDFYGGGLMLLIGLLVARAGFGYRAGTLHDMGPGYFPAALGIILAVIGLLIALSASFVAGKGMAALDLGVDGRGAAAILLGTLAFIVLGQYGGLVPATFAIVFIAVLGDRSNSMVTAVSLSLAMVAVSVVVFWWALQLQMPLFQWG
jgi:hypothetical protein